MKGRSHKIIGIYHSRIGQTCHGSSAGCEQPVHPETVAQQDASSSAVRLASDMTLATRPRANAPFTRRSKPNIFPLKLFSARLTVQVRSSVQDEGTPYHLPNLTGRDLLFEQAVFPNPKEVPVKEVPMTGIPVQAFPVRNSGEIRAVPTQFLQKFVQEYHRQSRFDNQIESSPVCGCYFQRIVSNFIASGQHIKIYQHFSE